MTVLPTGKWSYTVGQAAVQKAANIAEHARVNAASYNLPQVYHMERVVTEMLVTQ